MTHSTLAPAALAPTETLSVRRLNAADFSAWLPLWNGYLTFYAATLAPEITERTFARLLDPTEPMWAAVAQRGDQLLGLVNCVVHRSTWSLTHYAYLEDLFVAPDARGSGAGRALIEWVQQQARAQQCSKLYWHTQRDNLQAQQLYNRLARQSGFIEYQMDL